MYRIKPRAVGIYPYFASISDFKTKNSTVYYDKLKVSNPNININSLGNKTLYGTLDSNREHLIYYDGTSFRLINQSFSKSGSISSIGYIDVGFTPHTVMVFSDNKLQIVTQTHKFKNDDSVGTSIKICDKGFLTTISSVGYIAIG